MLPVAGRSASVTTHRSAQTYPLRSLWRARTKFSPRDCWGARPGTVVLFEARDPAGLKDHVYDTLIFRAQPHRTIVICCHGVDEIAASSAGNSVLRYVVDEAIGCLIVVVQSASIGPIQRSPSRSSSISVTQRLDSEFESLYAGVYRLKRYPSYRYRPTCVPPR